MSTTPPATPRKPFPGFLQGTLLMGLLLVVQFGTGLAIAVLLVLAGLVLGRETQATPSPPLMIAVVNLITFSVVIAIAAALSRRRLRELFPLRGPVWRLVPALVPLLLGYSIVFSELDNLLRMLIAPPPWLETVLGDLATGRHSVWASMLAVVIVAPVTEEMLFRGVILRGFLLRYSPIAAILLSSLLFAVSHANPWQFAGPLALGVLFGWIFHKTRSLSTVMLAHALANGTPLLIGACGISIPGYSLLEGPPALQPLWFDVLGVMLLGAGLTSLLSGLRRIERLAEPSAQP